MKSPSFEAPSLEANLRARVRSEVRFDNGSRALYATDGSNYRQVPIGVVVPQDINDVIETVTACNRFDVPVLPRGGGTSLAGQCCNVAVVIDMSKYVNHVLEIDPIRKLARVQPGTVLDTLRNAAEQYHLTFGPDPATHGWCTLGGMIGNNSCGVHSVMAGSFGFEKDHYEVSITCGERALLPTVRNAASETLVIADGFSCREQIAQNTDRRALHLAQVFHMALRQEDRSLATYSETQELRQAKSASPSLSLGTVTLIGAGILFAGTWLLRIRAPRSDVQLSESVLKFPQRRVRGPYENPTDPRTAWREDVRGRFRQR